MGIELVISVYSPKGNFIGDFSKYPQGWGKLWIPDDHYSPQRGKDVLRRSGRWLWDPNFWVSDDFWRDKREGKWSTGEHGLDLSSFSLWSEEADSPVDSDESVLYLTGVPRLYSPSGIRGAGILVDHEGTNKRCEWRLLGTTAPRPSD